MRSVIQRARIAARPLVYGARTLYRRIDAKLRPARPWDGVHHPALLKFPRWEGESDGQFSHDFLGVRTDVRFRPQFRPDPAGPMAPDYPSPHAAYFELVFVLQSILDDRGERPFTIVEVGAGYGYWLAVASRALQRLEAVPARLVGVEMVPQHFEWMAEHLRNNGVDPADARLIHAAASDVTGSASFVPEPDPALSFGHRLFDRAGGDDAGPTGGGEIQIPCIRLSELVEEYDSIDLVHIDVQGEERRILPDALASLAGRARRVLVATHGNGIHRQLRRLFQGGDWKLEFDFGCRKRVRTPFGDVRFLDGMLAAVNRRFVSGD